VSHAPSTVQRLLRLSSSPRLQRLGRLSGGDGSTREAACALSFAATVAQVMACACSTAACACSAAACACSSADAPGSVAATTITQACGWKAAAWAATLAPAVLAHQSSFTHAVRLAAAALALAVIAVCASAHCEGEGDEERAGEGGGRVVGPAAAADQLCEGLLAGATSSDGRECAMTVCARLFHRKTERRSPAWP